MNQPNKWWGNPGCSFDQVNICGILNGSFFKSMAEECDQCSIKFNLLRRKKQCQSCGLMFCSSCLKTSDPHIKKCRKCHILSLWPIERSLIDSLRVKDLQHYLRAYKIATHSCTEKKDLVDLVIANVKYKHYSSQHFIGGHRNRQPQPPNEPSDGIRVTAINSSIRHNSEDEGIRVFAVPPDQSEQAPSSSSSSSSWDIVQPEEEVTVALESQQSEPPPNSEHECEQPDISSTETEDPAMQTEQITTVQPSIVQDDQSQYLTSAETIAPQSSDTPAQASSSLGISKIIKLSSLVEEDDIKKLSVRQCKEILSLHRVDFSGVWEKHELVKKLVILWKDYKDRYADIDSLPEDQVCKICMDAPMDCVFLQCGHVAACTFCGKQCAECPICRQNVIRIVRIFKA